MSERGAEGGGTARRKSFKNGLAIAPFDRNVYHTQMKSADLIRELAQQGWRLVRVRGSHHVFAHPSRRGRIVVPHPKKDLGVGLVAAIRRQALEA